MMGLTGFHARIRSNFLLNTVYDHNLKLNCGYLREQEFNAPDLVHAILKEYTAPDVIMPCSGLVRDHTFTEQCPRIISLIIWDINKEGAEVSHPFASWSYNKDHDALYCPRHTGFEMVVMEREPSSISGVEMTAGGGTDIDETDEEQSYSGPAVYTEYPPTPETSKESDAAAESDDIHSVD